MVLKRYALIDPETGKVENCAAWDGVTPWSPGDALILREVGDDVSAGDVLDFATDTFSRPEPIIPVPEVVSRMQALLALDAASLLDDVEALVATQARAAQIAWANAPDFHRVSPLLNQLWAALGRTQDELDDLFRQAGAIKP